MNTGVPHLCVCICTFKRPQLLAKLLAALENQKTDNRFTYSAVVVDNDASASARETCTQAAGKSRFAIRYAVETQQSIAMARNRAMAESVGDFLAFIDDDEYPPAEWLLLLFQTCEAAQVTGVLAPVRPDYESPPPKWAVKSGLFDRPEYPTGTPLSWRDTRTGNALVRRSVLAEIHPPFRPEFANGGEDQDFFRRLIERGHKFIWCNEAAVFELVPADRVSRRYMCRRALLRGQNERHMLNFRSVAKSMVAAFLYALVLPVLLLLGQHVFLRYLIRFCDHAGKLCAAMGINPMGTRYLSG